MIIMQILETHAESEKQAMELSAKYLNVEAALIKLKVHKKGGSGFLGFGNKKPNIYYVYAIQGKTPRNIVVRGALSTMIHKMGYRAKIVDIREDEDNKIHVELSSPQAGHIIGRKGKTLESLQALVNTMVEKFLEKPVGIILNIENYREKRQNMLEQMSRRMADQVIEKGRSRITEPLNPYERRIVHLTLEDHDKVTTESIGVGNLKKVRIKPIQGVSISKPAKDFNEEGHSEDTHLYQEARVSQKGDKQNDDLPEDDGQNDISHSDLPEDDGQSDISHSDLSEVEKEQQEQFEQDKEEV